MTVIEIPMNAWSKERLLTGQKTCTARNKIYGEVGNEIDGGTEDLYRLKNIMYIPLWFVRDFLWFQEGAKSPEEYEKVWIDIHPRKGFIGEQKVYVHFFTNPKSYKVFR